MNPSYPQTPSALTELRYLDPARLVFSRGSGRLRLTVDAECSHLDVRVVRLFPISSATQYLSLRDDANNEIGILREPTALDPASAALVAEDLQRRYLTARILRVHTARERFGVVEWTVTTDLGEHAFSTRDLRDNVIAPSPGRYLMRDVDGNRYEIPDIESLDPASRTALMRYL